MAINLEAFDGIEIYSFKPNFAMVVKYIVRVNDDNLFSEQKSVLDDKFLEIIVLFLD